MKVIYKTKLTLKDKLPIGQYKGNTIGFLLETTSDASIPEYLDWFFEHTNYEPSSTVKKALLKHPRIKGPSYYIKNGYNRYNRYDEYDEHANEYGIDYWW